MEERKLFSMTVGGRRARRAALTLVLLLATDTGPTWADQVAVSGAIDQWGAPPLPGLASASPGGANSGAANSGAASALPESSMIDLANALALGGASSLQVGIARARTLEAQARFLEAKALWVPSLRFGVGYNNHSGRLQQTEGNVLEISRSSLFFGGGGGLGDAPLAGGSSGPMRMMVNLSLADAAFAPLIARHAVQAARGSQDATFNDELLAIADGYFRLVETHAMLANNRQVWAHATQMVDQVTKFSREGLSTTTEVERARAEQAARLRSVVDSERQVDVASARLAQLVRLQPGQRLIPAEELLVPATFLSTDLPVDRYIAQAQVCRPEVRAAGARIESTCWRAQQETWRPWLPNVQVGASGGVFGGGRGSNYLNDGSRSDVDLLAVWELRNAGLGNVALQQQSRHLHRQAQLDLQLVRDRVAAEVVAAYAGVRSYRQQVEISRQAVDASARSYELNFATIKEGEGLPLELIQSISALASATNGYAADVAAYHRAQYQLMRAAGQPPGVNRSVDVPAAPQR